METSECIDWPFASTNGYGYGVYTRHGQRIYAHRAALSVATVLAGGLVDHDDQALHSCDRPICVNPRHLRWGSQGDNMADSWNRKRRKPNPPRGEQHPHTTLDERRVRALRKEIAEGATGREVALRYGVCQSTVSNIVRGETWGHVH